MSALITDNDQLLAVLPNAVRPVAGEAPLIEKVADHLDAAEHWVADTFIGWAIYDTLVTDPLWLGALGGLVNRIVATEALANALPALDLVLTTNGLGVVSNQNIAPASKERTERLLASLIRTRDTAIDAVLQALPGFDVWCGSQQYFQYVSTLFPYPSLLTGLLTEPIWQDYCQTLPRIKAIEAVLAEDYFSAALMDALRSNFYPTDEYRILRDGIRDIIRTILRTDKFPERTIIALVNTIRNNPDSFPEWASSPTAKLFSPPIFTNKKQSRGYFF